MKLFSSAFHFPQVSLIEHHSVTFGDAEAAHFRGHEKQRHMAKSVFCFVRIYLVML